MMFVMMCFTVRQMKKNSEQKSNCESTPPGKACSIEDTEDSAHWPTQLHWSQKSLGHINTTDTPAFPWEYDANYMKW